MPTLLVTRGLGARAGGLVTGGLVGFSNASGGVVVPLPLPYRDRDAFDGVGASAGILGLVQATREFDSVYLAEDPGMAPVTAGDRRYAIVVPSGEGQRDTGSPWRKLRVVEFEIMVFTDLPDGPESWRELDRLFAVLHNALDGRSYGGFTLFERSRIIRDRTALNVNPGARMTLVGQFAYVVNTRLNAAYSTAR